jgi:hypothetical protein
MEKYRAIKDITEKGWGNEPNEIKQGDILEVRRWGGCDTLILGDKAVCDTDSQMCSKYFELIKE